jgi:hypothetical protein
MTYGAGWGRKILDRECAWFCLPIPGISGGLVGDAMRGFDIYLILRVVGTDVAVIAGFRLTGLLQAEFMPEMAHLALTWRTIYSRFSDIVTSFTGEAGHRFALELVNIVAGFIRHIVSFRYDFIHGEQFWR